MNKKFENIISLFSLVENKQIFGRKKVQKIFHILQCKGFDFNENFKFYYYGPYSIELQLRIDLLVKQAIIEENNKDNGSGYEYILRDDNGIEPDIELKKHSDLINYLNLQQSQVLEFVSTVYYLLENKISDSKDKAFLKSLSLKPKLKDKMELAKNVYDEIEKQSYRAI